MSFFFLEINHNLKSTWKNTRVERVVWKSDRLSQAPAYMRVNNQIGVIRSGATCS